MATENTDDEDDVTLSEYTVTDKFDDTTTQIPDYIVDRTENILSKYPMTNQNIILDLAQWWFDNVGNCAIYKWCVHHLDGLENDVTNKYMVFNDALDQAEEIGLDVREADDE